MYLLLLLYNYFCISPYPFWKCNISIIIIENYRRRRRRRRRFFPSKNVFFWNLSGQGWWCRVAKSLSASSAKRRWLSEEIIFLFFFPNSSWGDHFLIGFSYLRVEDPYKTALLAYDRHPFSFYFYIKNSRCRPLLCAPLALSPALPR